MSGAIPPLPLYAFMAWGETASIFIIKALTQKSEDKLQGQQGREEEVHA